MSAAEFKAKCLKVMDRVAESGETVVVTKRGKAVARVVPVSPRSGRLRGFSRGRVQIHGDVITSVEEPWDADER